MRILPFGPAPLLVSLALSLAISACFDPSIELEDDGGVDGSSGGTGTPPATDSATASTSVSGSSTDPSATATMTSTTDTTAADETATSDRVDESSGGEACDGEPAAITGITVSSDMGECCGGSLAAMINGAGLTGGALDLLDAEHNCSDADGWKSNGTQAGVVQLDFDQPYLVSRIYVWNSGQVNGERGVDEVSIQTSLDGVRFEDLAGGPESFAIADVCPVGVEAFELATPPVARSIRIQVLSTHDQSGISNTGLGEVVFFGTPCG